jgi:hypothetical protein
MGAKYAAHWHGSGGADARGSGGGFNFDRCLSRCMGMDDAYHCSRKCGRKQANFQWRQLEGKTISRSDPHHPRHPQFHDPDPHHHEHH